MFDNIENLKILYSYQGTSKAHSVITRKNYAFIFRTSGTGIFEFSDKKIVTNEGDMIFIPKGATYELKLDPEKECKFVSITFEADFADPKPTLFSLENFSETSFICAHFPKLWTLGSQSEKYKCISLFYSLLSYISNIENVDYSFKRRFNLIEPAVCYLRSHIYDLHLQVNKLHLLCDISDAYFRKIFISKFGMSPQQYIISKRISQAKSLIDSKSFGTISEIARSVGYSDPLYFSRAFKKRYGCSPLNVNKEV